MIQSVEQPLPVKASVRLDFLDGVRAVAALSVVLFHAYTEIGDSAGSHLESGIRQVLSRLFFGYASVDVFIVLSGFCLGIPIVKAAKLTIDGGVAEYMRRRARRILPAYFAACLFCLTILAFFPAIGKIPGAGWASTLPPFSEPVILSHLLLIHNLRVGWSLNIDVPLWSVATEWQIYFALPLMLLPVWRRYGPATMLGVAFASGLGLACLGFEPARHWFLGLFALGLVASALSFQPEMPGKKAPWGIIAITCAIAAEIAHYISPAPRSLGTIVMVDGVVGVATAAGLVYGAKSALSTHPSALIRLLSSRSMVTLGGFSYSLYLFHAPILAITHFITWRLGWNGMRSLTAMYVFAVPVSLFVAYLASLAFERPWLRKRRSAESGMLHGLQND